MAGGNLLKILKTYPTKDKKKFNDKLNGFEALFWELILQKGTTTIKNRI